MGGGWTNLGQSISGRGPQNGKCKSGEIHRQGHDSNNVTGPVVHRPGHLASVGSVCRVYREGIRNVSCRVRSQCDFCAQRQTSGGWKELRSCGRGVEHAYKRIRSTSWESMKRKRCAQNCRRKWWKPCFRKRVSQSGWRSSELPLCDYVRN